MKFKYSILPLLVTIVLTPLSINATEEDRLHSGLVANVPEAAPQPSSEQESDDDTEGSAEQSAPTASALPAGSNAEHRQEDYSVPQLYSEAPFMAKFPARPVRSVERHESINRSIICYRYTDAAGNSYEASFADLNAFWPGEITQVYEDPNRCLINIEVNRAKQSSASLKDAAMTFAGHKAKEYELTFAAKGSVPSRVERKVLFVDGRRAYIVGCSGDPTWVRSSVATSFVDSFKIGNKSDSAPSTFKWQEMLHPVDVAAVSTQTKQLQKKVELNTVESVYNSKVPHFPYVPEFPGKVRLTHVGTNFVRFQTTKSPHEVFVFYTTKMRENCWKFKDSPAGTMKAYVEPGGGKKSVCLDIEVTRKPGCTEVYMVKWEAIIIKMRTYSGF